MTQNTDPRESTRTIGRQLQGPIGNSDSAFKKNKTKTDQYSIINKRYVLPTAAAVLRAIHQLPCSACTK